jgi:hypothetical protein
MPELPVKDVRLSELHLPELKRDDIMRALSEIPRPDVDLTKLERPKIDLPDAVSKFEWPKVDVGKAMSDAAHATGIRRRSGPPRWPLAVGGLIVTGLAAWAILTNETVRAWLSDVANNVRQRFSTMRSTDDDLLQYDADEPIAFNSAETAPIESAPYSDSSMVDATGYPEGLGSTNGDGMPAFEESGTRD